MLWLCVHLPDLPIEICSRGAHADLPLVIREGEGREQRVVAVNKSARRVGIHVGMRVSEAHTLVSELVVKARDSTAEQEALERLATWSGQFTSCVSLVAPRALLLEVEGSCRLYGGLGQVIERVREGLRGLGYTARLAVAPTPLGATWLAWAGREAEIKDYAALFSALADLPLECLMLESDREDLLKGLGLMTLVDCLRLPRDGIARRVGPQILDALDRAFGRIPDPRPAFVPPERFRARLGLPAPISQREALLFPLHRLLLELGGFLVARGAGITVLQITLHSTRSTSTCVSLNLVSPSRDATHLTNLVRERLERLTLAAPVEEIILEADSLIALASQPLDFFTGAKTADVLRIEMVEQFQARLGREAVQSIAGEAEHRPERAWSYVPPGTAAPAIGNGYRPMWLLSAPIALNERQGQLYWEGALAFEPECERIESGWWDDEEIGRDYFVARNAKGQRLWVFREIHTERWFLHGVFS